MHPQSPGKTRDTREEEESGAKRTTPAWIAVTRKEGMKQGRTRSNTDLLGGGARAGFGGPGGVERGDAELDEEREHRAQRRVHAQQPHPVHPQRLLRCTRATDNISAINGTAPVRQHTRSLSRSRPLAPSRSLTLPLAPSNSNIANPLFCHRAQETASFRTCLTPARTDLSMAGCSIHATGSNPTWYQRRPLLVLRSCLRIVIWYSCTPASAPPNLARNTLRDRARTRAVNTIWYQITWCQYQTWRSRGIGSYALERYLHVEPPAPRHVGRSTGGWNKHYQHALVAPSATSVPGYAYSARRQVADRKPARERGDDEERRGGRQVGA
eukprot:3715026-Rhodomonas_salina.3